VAIDGSKRRPVWWIAGGIACMMGAAVGRPAAASDTVLPDGTDFPMWEQPLQFSKTYYVDADPAKGNDSNPGTSGQPFRTINKAAEVLQPGERVVIAAGTYRECVQPARGGTGPDRMISYEAAPGAKVLIKGSEALNDDWQPSNAASMRGGGGGGARPMYLWQHELTNALFPDAYNPFALDDAQGNRGWLDTKAVDMGPYFRKRGLIWVDGMPLEPVESSSELGSSRMPMPATQPTTQPATNRGGMPTRIRPGPIMTEIGGNAEAKFWVDTRGTTIHMRVPAETPPKPLIEITTREQVFLPQQSGLGYIRLKGLTFQHGATNFPPPQRGLVSTRGGNHWIIEGNTIEWDNAVGLDIGNGDFGARSASPVGFHIIRGNTIRYCGIEGIGGMGTQNVLVEDNLIEWVGWQGAERAWESAGAKFHGARNMLFRHNVVRHIRNANALWLDSSNVNCRVTANVFADVLTVSAAIHMEMNRNYDQIDNNVIWNVRNAEPGTPGQRGCAGSGIFLHASERQIVAQNLIGRCDNAGVFCVLREERAGAGTGMEHMIHNNIFTTCGKAAIVFVNPISESDGNVFVGLPTEAFGLLTSDAKQWLDLAAWRESHGWDKNGAVGDMEVDFDPDRLELTMKVRQALPTVKIFNHIDSDMAGKPTGEARAPGPFADPGAPTVRKIDPRVARQ
jgi:hypothetical protein